MLSFCYILVFYWSDELTALIGVLHLHTLFVQVEPSWCLKIKRKLHAVKATVCSTLSSTGATASTVDDVWLRV